MTIIFIGKSIRAGFIREALKNEKLKISGESMELVCIDNETGKIADQLPEITLNITNSNCKYLVLDIDEYVDDPEVLIAEVLNLKKGYAVEPIFYCPTIKSNNSIVAEARNKGFKLFVNASNTLTDQKKEFVFCITKYYENVKHPDLEIVDRELKEQHISASKYKTIGVVGTIHRMGTTTQAIQIVKFLQSKGFKTCYVELNNTKYKNIAVNTTRINELSYTEKLKIMAAEKDIDREEPDIGLVRYNGTDLFYKPDHLPEILNMGYEYIVYDYGVYNDPGFNKSAYLKDDFGIFVAGVSPSEIDYTFDILENLSYTNSKFLFSFVNEDEKNDFINQVAIPKEIVNKCFFSGYAPNAFSLSNATEYEKMLKSILPEITEEIGIVEKHKKEKKGFFFMKKKGLING